MVKQYSNWCLRNMSTSFEYARINGTRKNKLYNFALGTNSEPTILANIDTFKGLQITKHADIKRNVNA